MNSVELTIGEVAARAGIRASAIRYYESVGLIPEPERVSGRRRYGEEVIERLGVIGIAKEARFSLEEIRTLLDATDEGAPAHGQLRALASRKLPEIDALIDRATTVRAWLATASECGCSTLDMCGLFKSPETGSGDQIASALPLLAKGRC